MSCLYKTNNKNIFISNTDILRFFSLTFYWLKLKKNILFYGEGKLDLNGHMGKILMHSSPSTLLPTNHPQNLPSPPQLTPPPVTPIPIYRVYVDLCQCVKIFKTLCIMKNKKKYDIIKI